MCLLQVPCVCLQAHEKQTSMRHFDKTRQGRMRAGHSCCMMVAVLGTEQAGGTSPSLRPSLGWAPLSPTCLHYLLPTLPSFSLMHFPCPYLYACLSSYCSPALFFFFFGHGMRLPGRGWHFAAFPGQRPSPAYNNITVVVGWWWWWKDSSCLLPCKRTAYHLSARTCILCSL